MNTRHAVVAGGGIGGLTAAVALHQRGWAVTVCERAESLEPVGSGMSLAPNALRAMDAIGLGGAARALAVAQGKGGIRRRDGRWLMRTDMGALAETYGDPFIYALRSEVVSLLVSALPEGVVRTGTAVEEVDAQRGAVTTSAGELEADLVVAADGVRSAIRQAIFPGHPGPRYSGTSAWRLVLPEPRPGLLRSETTEAWGRGEVFGCTELSGGRIYCYASAVTPEGTTFGDDRAELLRRFGGWYDPIPELLAAARTEQILHNDVYWMARPLPALHSGRVALLGDAAHAMSPNLGQGACQAMEDAVVLAYHAARGDDLAAYTAARLRRTAMVVRRSHQASQAAAVSWPPAVALRDTGLRAASRIMSRLLVRQMAPLADWTPPDPAPVRGREVDA